MDGITEAIARNIRERRRALGLTQASLAEAIGYSVKAVSKWDSGRGVPPTVILPALAKALKTDIDCLLSAESEELFYLGIDGGGTKTEFALASAEGKILRSLRLAASNPSDIGAEAAITVLRDGIAEITAGIPKSRISLFAGLAGGTTQGVREKLSAFFASLGFLSAKAGSDAENAVAASLGRRDGIAVIMGTGSVTFAQSEGRLYRTGGYGYLLGDAGSGFAFGRDAILAALMAEDGSGRETLLLDAVRAKCGGESVLAKLGDFYKGGKRTVASYAPCLFEAYQEGDATAKDILEKNILAVAETVRGAMKHLRGTSLPVVICGGIADAYGDTVIPHLEKALTHEAERVEISHCAYPLIYGALMLAGMPEKGFKC